MMKYLAILAIFWAFGANAGTTECSNADQTIKYSIQYREGTKSIIELSLGSKVVYKTTADGRGEVNEADYSFLSETQKDIATILDIKREIKTSYYSSQLEISLQSGRKKLWDFVICKDVRSSKP